MRIVPVATTIIPILSAETRNGRRFWRTASQRRVSSALTALALAGALFLIAPATIAHAQLWNQRATPGVANIEGVTVEGKGRATVRPDVLEIEMNVDAASELTADAIVKFRDAKKRIRDAVAGLKLPNLTVEERGLLVSQKAPMANPYYFDYQPNTRTKTEVQLARKLVVRAKGVRDMGEEAVMRLVGKLLDVAQDAGAHVGPDQKMPTYYYYNFGMVPPGNGLVRFVLEDYDKAEEAAFEKAIADARARAERLARLGRFQLGPIVALREVMVPDQQSASLPTPEDDSPERKRIETSKYQEIAVHVELLVRFDVGPPKAGQAAGAPAPDRAKPVTSTNGSNTGGAAP